MVAEPECDTAALAGRLESISLFDIAQFLMLNRKTGLLRVHSGAGGAFIYFEEGQIINAVDENLRHGEGVVVAAVQWAAGTFKFEPGPVTCERTISTSTDNVLLEAARKIDEYAARSAGGQPGRGAGPAKEMEAAGAPPDSGSEGEGGARSPVESREALLIERQKAAMELVRLFQESACSQGTGSSGATRPIDQLLAMLRHHEGGRLHLDDQGGMWLQHGERTSHLEFPPGSEIYHQMAHRLLGKSGLKCLEETGQAWCWTEGGDGCAYVAAARAIGARQHLVVGAPGRLPPAPDALGLPEEILGHLINRSEGLILVGGLPRGGKSRVLWSLIAHLPRLREGPSVILEDWPLYQTPAAAGPWWRDVLDPRRAGEQVRELIAQAKPEVVAVDQLGSPDLLAALLEAADRGCVALATITGAHPQQVAARVERLLQETGWTLEAAEEMLAGGLCVLPLEGKDEDREVVMVAHLWAGPPPLRGSPWVDRTEVLASFRGEVERLTKAGRLQGEKALGLLEEEAWVVGVGAANGRSGKAGSRKKGRTRGDGREEERGCPTC